MQDLERRCWDVLVVGAGPAGSSTAAHLAQAGRDVLLIDRAHFPRDKPCAEYTSPETEQVLRRLGAWSTLESSGIRRLRGMLIISPSGRRFASEHLAGGERRHSLALPRLVLDNLLLNQARANGAEHRGGLEVVRPLVEAGRVRGVVVRGPARTSLELRAGLVIGADGLRSRLARALGQAQAARWPRRFGLATHVRDFDGPTEWGEMYIGRGGYCGLAPLPGGLTTVAAALPLRTRPGRAAEQPGRAGALEQLTRMLRDHPDLVRRLSAARFVKPLQGVGPFAWKVPRVAGPGFLLVGDAAGFFDPLTGEGIYRAVRGAELAAEAILETPPHDWPLLERRYRQLRQQTFSAKERLARLIQLFVNFPPLLDYALERLGRRPELAQRLSAALGDYGPAEAAIHPLYLARLLRP